MNEGNARNERHEQGEVQNELSPHKLHDNCKRNKRCCIKTSENRCVDENILCNLIATFLERNKVEVICQQSLFNKPYQLLLIQSFQFAAHRKSLCDLESLKVCLIHQERKLPRRSI